MKTDIRNRARHDKEGITFKNCLCHNRSRIFISHLLWMGRKSRVYLNRLCAECTRTRDIRVEILVLTSYSTRCRAVESLKWHSPSSKPRVARQICVCSAQHMFQNVIKMSSINIFRRRTVFEAARGHFT